MARQFTCLFLGQVGMQLPCRFLDVGNASCKSFQTRQGKQG
jgi:hypothetical protein